MRESKKLTEIARMRVASGLSQKELADKLNIGRDHLAKIEAGVRQSNRVSKDAMAILSAVAH
jgi:DNA-binding transcriptional regulator YiaG